MERTFAGREDLGGRLINKLRIGQIIRRDPEPVWTAQCTACLTHSEERHARLLDGSAKCLASICGRAAVREACEETPAKARRRQQEAEAKVRREAEAREAAKLAALESECGGCPMRGTSASASHDLRDSSLRTRT